jgi:chromate transporter
MAPASIEAPHSTAREAAPPPGGLAEVARVFLRLGCSSFGGPVAHLGYFRAEIVQKRQWLNDARYADLVALCQFLPGPASSQVVFALGMLRAGLGGALVASLCFTLPSALLMLAFARGITLLGDVQHAGFLHGLKVAAVPIVAQAVWGMGKSLCPDRARRCLCVAAAAALLLSPSAVVQLGVIAAGGVVGGYLYRNDPTEITAQVTPSSRSQRGAAAAALLVFGVLLVALPALALASRSRAVAEVDAFFRSGALVFGGGHVVLPLLRAELVPRGWLGDDAFLAGYGAAQALPGPLFAFSAYLGAAMHPEQPWLGGVRCLLALFAPAWLLIGGALPFWDRLRSRRWARAALAGANAAVVGVLLAALYRPVMAEAIRAEKDVVAVLIGFALLQYWKAPPWLVVGALAAAGRWLT